MDQMLSAQPPALRFHDSFLWKPEEKLRSQAATHMGKLTFSKEAFLASHLAI